MPTYAYKCDNCDVEFERSLSVSDRNVPTEQQCPRGCEQESVRQLFRQINLLYGFTKKTPDSFRQIIGQIDKQNPDNNLDLDKY